MPMFRSYRNQSIDVHCKSIDWFLYAGNIGMKKVTASTLKEKNWLQDRAFVYVLCEIISSNTVFKTVSTLFAAVVLKLKQLLIIYFSFLTTYIKEKPFWTILHLSFLIIWNKFALILITFFSLLTCLSMTLQIQLS